MAFQYETVKLEKGMYGEGGKRFSQVLEEHDPQRTVPRHGPGGAGRLSAPAEAL